MERILRLQEEIDAIKADIREIYAEEKSDGGDKTAMGAAISTIRKRSKDKDAFDEREALTDVYLNAYFGASHAHAREGRSEITSPNTSISGYDSAGADDLSDIRDSGPQLGSQAAQSHGDGPSAPAPLTGQGCDASPVTNSPETAERGAGPETDPASDGGAVALQLASPSTIVPFHTEETREQRTLRLKPHCQRPSACSGVGRDHCFTCKKAMAETPEPAA